ncbi:hypothetical protein [Desulforegula conservatrix]|uniref:hypothetical protein n=1 Tax=Desulforegula conservatrix TaxID=153026 RepID=UPI0018DCCCAB|nr:hypothetical protein [Desulforegula conservatrix]
MSKNTMYYLSGEEILIGDIVNFSGCIGEIVFVVSSSQFSKLYPENSWQCLETGFGVKTEKYGLVHQIKPDEDLVFIRRNNQNT